MLLTNRRHRLLFMSLAGLEIAWFLPFAGLLLVYWAPRSPFSGFEQLSLLANQPLLAVGVVWLIMLGYMLLVDRLDHYAIDAPLRQITILVALILTSIGACLLLLYEPGAWLTLEWAGALFGAMFDFTAGLRPELIILLLNFFLWFRVAAFTDRAISFFSVGLSFRVAMLLALAGNGLLTTLGGLPAAVGIQFFTLTVAFGLCAAALARLDDKAQSGAQSTGALLPWSRLFQILLTIAAVIVVSLFLAYWFTPDRVRTVLGWTTPFWQLLGAIFGQILLWFLILITPFFEWLAAIIQARLAEMEPLAPMEPMPADPEFMGLGEITDRSALFRYCLVTGTIVAALGLLWLFLVRTRRRKRTEEDEQIEPDTDSPTGGSGGLGFDRLRAWFNLLRRYGFSAQLLAAVSVENIYANLLRLAAQQGVRRPASVPPDRFLPRLEGIFPRHGDELRRITLAYMRVYYGNRNLESKELEQIKADYAGLKASLEGDASNSG